MGEGGRAFQVGSNIPFLWRSILLLNNIKEKASWAAPDFPSLPYHFKKKKSHANKKTEKSNKITLPLVI